MTIHRNRGKISFECDGCDEVLETSTDDFDEARAKLREADWRIKKEVDLRWYHLCPSCKK